MMWQSSENSCQSERKKEERREQREDRGEEELAREKAGVLSEEEMKLGKVGAKEHKLQPSRAA